MNKDNGAWILPSRGRPDILERFFLHASLMGMTTRGHVLINLQDPKFDEYEKMKFPDGWDLLASNQDSLAESVRAFLPHYKSWDWVGLITDDVVPETERWDEKILEWLDERTIVSCDDGSQAPRRMVGAVAFPVSIFRAVGYWYPPGFKHCFVDDIWEDLGRSCECWRVRMDVVVRHLHPWVTGQKPDETHAHAYSQEFWNNDRALFDDWKLYKRAASIHRLREFVSRDPLFARVDKAFRNEEAA